MRASSLFLYGTFYIGTQHFDFNHNCLLLKKPSTSFEKHIDFRFALILSWCQSHFYDANVWEFMREMYTTIFIYKWLTKRSLCDLMLGIKIK